MKRTIPRTPTLAVLAMLLTGFSGGEKPAGGATHVLVEGIYLLDGDMLKINGAEGNNPRPTDFTTGPGDGRSLVVLKRGPAPAPAPRRPAD
jgi:hypothetical protein